MAALIIGCILVYMIGLIVTLENESFPGCSGYYEDGRCYVMTKSMVYSLKAASASCNSVHPTAHLAHISTYAECTRIIRNNMVS